MSDKHIEGSPAQIARAIRSAPARTTFFVFGNTPLYIDNSDRYLPLYGSVVVTKKAIITYLSNLQDTATNQEDYRNVKLSIKMTVLGQCWFI